MESIWRGFSAVQMQAHRALEIVLANVRTARCVQPLL